jgi:hypothetical protein
LLPGHYNDKAGFHYHSRGKVSRLSFIVFKPPLLCAGIVIALTALQADGPYDIKV